MLEYFRKATAITAELPRPEPRTIIEIIDDIWNNRDRDYNIRCLVKRLQRIDRDMAAEASDSFASHIPDGDVGRFASELPERLRRDFTATMALLRDEEFQRLLTGYARKPRTFIVAYEADDTVSSTVVLRVGDREYKPDDYIAAFVRFIKENQSQIEAIKVLLDRPKDWKPEVLKDLRQKLAAAPQRFTVENLRRAHEYSYLKALADIISMVNHAAPEEEPLYTAQQRVNRAMMRVTGSRSFTAEQMQWLERIRQHLIENLSVDEADFESLPIFNRYEGLGSGKSGI